MEPVKIQSYYVSMEMDGVRMEFNLTWVKISDDVYLVQDDVPRDIFLLEVEDHGK